MNETENQRFTAAVSANAGKQVKWFVASAGAILALTGLAKAWSAIGPARALDASGPISGLLLRRLLLAVRLSALFMGFLCPSSGSGSTNASQSASHGRVMQEAMADPVTLFVAFANRSLAIKTIECELAAQTFQMAGKNLTGSVPFEASFQPDSFYIRHLSEVLKGRLIHTTNGPVFGVANRRAWLLTDGLPCYSAEVEEYPRASDYVSREVRQWESLLRQILTLGLDALIEEGTIELAQHRLTGRAADGSSVVGQICLDEKKRIKHVGFQLPKGVVSVDYEYCEGRLPWWLPSQILLTDQSSSGRSAVPFTITSCELGLVNSPQAYGPERFGAPSGLGRKAYYSNSIAWVVERASTNRIIPREELADARGSLTDRFVRLLTLTALVLLTLGLGLLLFLRRTGAVAQTDENRPQN